MTDGREKDKIQETQEKYGDMMDLPRHRSEKRAPMPMSKRAAQFAPFAALTGYGALIEDANRQADEEE